MARQRRHSNGFGIGQSITNQRSKKPFSVYKERLDTEAHLHYKIDFLHKNLSKEDKEKIKNKIRKQQEKINRRTIIITIIISILLALFTYHLIVKIMTR
jgi:hypothetical protein